MLREALGCGVCEKIGFFSSLTQIIGDRGIQDIESNREGNKKIPGCPEERLISIGYYAIQYQLK